MSIAQSNHTFKQFKMCVHLAGLAVVSTESSIMGKLVEEFRDDTTDC